MTSYKFSPKQHAAHVAAYRKQMDGKKQAKAAAELARIAAHYARFPKCNDTRFDLCNAIINLIDDGDVMAERAALMDELNCDEDGNDLERSAADCEADRADYIYDQRRDAQMMAQWWRAA